jgi:hypothetical protein
VSGEFDEAVNMTASELETWSGTDESKSVGQSDGGESVGREPGRRIVELVRTKKGDLTHDDRAHVRQVVGYVHRTWPSAWTGTWSTRSGDIR